MPKFYFDIHEVDGSVTNDTIGVELEDAAQAISEAQRAFADMAQDAIQESSLSKLKVVVRDEQGTVLASHSGQFRPPGKPHFEE